MFCSLADRPSRTAKRSSRARKLIGVGARKDSIIEICQVNRNVKNPVIQYKPFLSLTVHAFVYTKDLLKPPVKKNRKYGKIFEAVKRNL